MKVAVFGLIFGLRLSAPFTFALAASTPTAPFGLEQNVGQTHQDVLFMRAERLGPASIRPIFADGFESGDTSAWSAGSLN